VPVVTVKVSVVLRTQIVGVCELAKKIRLPSMAKKAMEQVFAKPGLAKYPFEKPQLSDNFRGQPVFDFDLCIGCGTCSKDCPSKAIDMVSVDGKRRPQLNLSKCIFCYQCADSCPKKAIKNSMIYELATTDKSTLVKTPQPNNKP
jgi:formate hydrogenlyase subunit 6/NADH:ubiquinone oxidoreductase subunit I